MLVNTVRRIPPAAALLGYGGLAPFAAGAAGAWAGPPFAALIGFWLLGYGAVILSFMAGVRWGTTMLDHPSDRPIDGASLALSVLPALIAWATLAPDALAAEVFGGAVGMRLRLVVLAASFVALLVWDLQAVDAGVAPAWYAPLRVRLTVGAVAALLVAAWSPAV